jgi:hypothetical protein
MRSIPGNLMIGWFVLALASAAAAQPEAPPPPDKYKVALRYRIIASRDTHVAFYDRMIDHLKNLNFDFDPPLEKHAFTDREDPGKDRLYGFVAADKAQKILANSSIAGLMLMPPDWKQPKDPEDPVHVRLELASGFETERQRELANQVRVLLRNHVSFREAVGYDHRGYTGKPFTRIAGTVPAGLLDLLLKDLRRLPTGWLATDMEKSDLPAPVRGVVPIRITEVLADDVALVDPGEAERRPAAFLEIVGPDLWALMTDQDQAGKNVPVQLVLAQPPSATDTRWRELLVKAAPTFFIEGHLGQFVTGRIEVRHIINLANLPAVSTIRSPQPARVGVDPALKIKGDNLRALRQSGLFDYHRIGYRGKGVRLAIIDHDFRGYEEMIQARRLPPKTRLVDLTTEKNKLLYPDPPEGDPKQLGHGTLCALAAALAAPEAELVLIRIDGIAPFHVHQVLRHMTGDPFTDLLTRRKDDLNEAWGYLRREREVILRERKRILSNFDDETDIMQDFEFLGAIRGWIFSEREWSFQRLQYQDYEEELWKEREGRYYKLTRDIRSLQGINLVASPFVWNDGYPLGQASPLTRWFDEPALSSGSRNVGRFPLWFQAAGNVRGQSWSGLFRDEDGNGIMEFAAANTPTPKGRWNHELNFLAWQPWDGPRSLDLPAKARVRLSLQWREPHDPDYFLRPREPDYYRLPLAQLRLVVLRQRDPEGKTKPADTFDVVARSLFLPERLAHVSNSSVYEHALEFVAEKPGRYAVRIERQLGTQWILRPDGAGKPSLGLLKGLIAEGIRPLGTSALPDLERKWELRPRLFCQVVDSPTRLAGRSVLLDYATDAGSLGIPSDARQIFTVGSVDLAGKPQPYSAVGPPANLELLNHPVLLTYDSLQLGPKDANGGAFGTSIAAAYAAGTAACLLSAGMTPQDVRTYVHAQRGKVLRIHSR